jgi:hypothetical protein
MSDCLVSRGCGFNSCRRPHSTFPEVRAGRWWVIAGPPGPVPRRKQQARLNHGSGPAVRADASHASVRRTRAILAPLAQRKSIRLRTGARAFDSSRGCQSLARGSQVGFLNRSVRVRLLGGAPSRRGRSAARMPACHVGDRGASPLRGPNEKGWMAEWLMAAVC